MTQERKTTIQKKTKKAVSSSDTSKPKKVTTKTSTSKKEVKNTKGTNSKVAKTSTKTNSSEASVNKTTRSSSMRKSTAKQTAPAVSFLPEYYDLPYRYNQTVIRILYQTPTTLFVYWDISDQDRKHYQEQYGENFFEVSKPVLVIHNKTKNYYFEVEIDDFANSWYLHVNDSDCIYEIELGRRAKQQEQIANLIPNNYLHIASSNNLETPNNHILLETIGKSIVFEDTKQKHLFSKSVADLPFLKNHQSVANYPIYEIYKKLYKSQLEGTKISQLSSSSSSFYSN